MTEEIMCSIEGCFEVVEIDAPVPHIPSQDEEELVLAMLGPQICPKCQSVIRHKMALFAMNQMEGK